MPGLVGHFRSLGTVYPNPVHPCFIYLEQKGQVLRKVFRYTPYHSQRRLTLPSCLCPFVPLCLCAFVVSSTTSKGHDTSHSPD